MLTPLVLEAQNQFKFSHILATATSFGKVCFVKNKLFSGIASSFFSQVTLHVYIEWVGLILNFIQMIIHNILYYYAFFCCQYFLYIFKTL